MSRKYAFCDTETTGVNSFLDHIIEIGIIITDDKLNIIETYHTLVKPTDISMISSIPEDVVKLDKSMILVSPSFKDIKDKVIELTSDIEFVAHNADFDINIINKELERIGELPLNLKKVVDTYKISKEHLNVNSYSLDSLCLFYNENDLYNQRALEGHSAILDCKILIAVFKNLLKVMHRKLPFAFSN